MASSFFFIFLSIFLPLISLSSSSQILLLPLTHSLSPTQFNSTPHLLKSTSTRFHHLRRHTTPHHRRQISLPLSPGSDYTISFSLGSNPPQTISLYMDTGSDLVWFPCHPFQCILCDGKYNPSTISNPDPLNLSASSYNPKKELVNTHPQNYYNPTPTVLQKEQGMAFAHAVAAVFATLVSFAECLGASRLMDACSWFIDLWKGKHETGQWLEIEAAEAMSNRSDFSAMNASGIMLSSMANKQNESHAASLDNRNKEVVVDVKQGSKKSDKDLKSKVAPDALDKKTVGPIRKGKTSKMSPWDDARARAEKVRAFKADLQKMKKKKDEEYRKRLEALKMEREKRIAAKTAQLASSQKTRKQLPTKLALSSVKGTKFSDSEPGSSCPPQRSKIRTTSTGSSESHKASKSNKSSNGSHLLGNRLTRPVSSLPEPWKENSDVTPDPKEEEYRKRLEALKMEREKRIAAKTAQLASSQKTRKQLPTKLALSSVKGTKFSDSQPGSSCPPQRSKIRAASTGSSESHKASKSNKSSNGSHLPGNRLTRPVSSLPEPRKENSDVTPDPKVPMARIQRLSEPKTVSSPYVAPVKSRRAELGSLSLVNVIDLESLPNMLQRKYALLRDLDKSLQDIQQQNEQHCEQEIEEIKRGIKSGNITPDASNIRFSDEVFDDQKHAIRIADEKVALAVQAYDLVDAHVQQLDQYLKKFDEELRRERESAATTGSAAQNLENNVKSTSGRGGRKKTRLAATTTASATANPTSMDLDLPVDPNEPTYCFCNQVSYGEMVARDNPDCKIEWFHFGCVGLKEQPKGKWYCSECVGMQKRRKGK